MNFRKLLFPAVMGVALAIAAAAQSISLWAPNNGGDVNFPGLTPTTIDNMVIGGKTPAAGTFAALTASSITNTGSSSAASVTTGTLTVNSSASIASSTVTGTETVNGGLTTVGLTATGTISAAGVSIGRSCGAVAQNGACGNLALSGIAKVYGGNATLSAGSSTITGISPAFQASTSFFCVANDITTSSNVVKAVPASASTVTFTGTGTDVISFICFGS